MRRLIFASLLLWTLGVQGSVLIPSVDELSLDEKIGQLFIVRIYSNGPDAHIGGQEQHVVSHVEEMILNHGVGGLILQRRWEPLVQRHLIQHYQSLSKIPLLITQDCEWGLAMRLDNTLAFPRNMTLGAIQDDNLLYLLGREIGRQCRLVGVHVNYAPVVDVNSNAANPVIGMRSFGSDSAVVGSKGIAVMRGLADAGILACAKHFPGHGDTTVDSHFTVPVVGVSREHLDSVELPPFRALIDAGVPMVMLGHVHVPVLDSTEDSVASLSPKVINGELRGALGFAGLVITDAVDMGALAHRPGAEVALQAILAGNDIVLCPQDLPGAIQHVKAAILDGRLSLEDINERVAKILNAKRQVMTCDALDEPLVTSEARDLRKRLYQAAITIVGDAGKLPLVDQGVAIVQVGGTSQSRFLREHAGPRLFLSYDSSEREREAVLHKLSEYETIVVAIHGSALHDVTLGKDRIPALPAHRYGVADATVAFVNALKLQSSRVVTVLFANPYSLQFFDKNDTILMAYEDDPDAHEAASNVLLGIVTPSGRLPTNASLKN